MLQPLLAVVAAVVASLVVIGIAFLLGMRAKSPLVLGAVVGLSKRWMNPAQLRTAGQPGAYAGIVRHRGRRSGRVYETPVGIVAVADGFLVALPYGAGTQWLRNVLAAGEATVVVDGATHAVDRPELVPMRTVADRFSPTDQRLFRLMRVEDCLRLRRAPLAIAA
jgi:deazaflavin-dependent oxidoreductase (nitroreductase family)